MNDTVISVQNISKCYQVFDSPQAQLKQVLWPKHGTNIQEVWALKDINFEIKRGEAVSIIGRNGGGKSTLLEIITGTLTPTTGEVKINGRVSALLELGSGFNPDYTGRDNIILNGLLLGLSRKEILARFDKIVDFAEIGDALNRPVKTYSSGMVMRLAFAVQVLCEPDILIIDEALSVGDFFFQQKCLGHIRGLCKKGMTLLFVSHDMGTVRDICNRAIYLKKGKKHYEGKVMVAIRKYISETSDDVDTEITTRTVENHDPSIEKNQNGVILKDAIWSAEEEKSEGNLGRLLAIGVYDNNDFPRSTFTVGETIKIVIAYQMSSETIADISVGLKNKFDQLCTVTGSRQLGQAPPEIDDSGGVIIFSLFMEMLLEAGNYSIIVTLGKATEANSGSRIDQAPPLGPLTLTWDYENKTAPFLGQVGLPTSCKFEVY
jgi:lipopolysaccharide transport system ATP-binding protein